MTTSPDATALCYAVPSIYCNHTQLACVNGMFRLTICEQSVLDMHTPNEVNVLVPRVAVTLTRDSAEELGKMLLAFVAQIDKANSLLTEARETGALQ